MYFNSDKCKLCAYQSKKHLHELFEEDNEGELNLVQLSIENESWYPEVLYYRIGKCFAASVFSLSIFNPLTDLSLTLSLILFSEYVPCFILLDKKNRARLKSTIPTDPARVLKSLHEIIEEGKKM